MYGRHVAKLAFEPLHVPASTESLIAKCPAELLIPTVTAPRGACKGPDANYDMPNWVFGNIGIDKRMK